MKAIEAAQILLDRCPGSLPIAQWANDEEPEVTLTAFVFGTISRYVKTVYHLSELYRANEDRYVLEASRTWRSRSFMCRYNTARQIARRLLDDYYQYMKDHAPERKGEANNE